MGQNYILLEELHFQAGSSMFYYQLPQQSNYLLQYVQNDTKIHYFILQTLASALKKSIGSYCEIFQRQKNESAIINTIIHMRGKKEQRRQPTNVNVKKRERRNKSKKNPNKEQIRPVPKPIKKPKRIVRIRDQSVQSQEKIDNTINLPKFQMSNIERQQKFDSLMGRRVERVESRKKKKLVKKVKKLDYNWQ